MPTFGGSRGSSGAGSPLSVSLIRISRTRGCYSPREPTLRPQIGRDG